MGKRRKTIIRTALCVACGCCVKVCSKKAVTIYKGLYALVDDALCVGCGKCAQVCPASIIEMEATE